MKPSHKISLCLAQYPFSISVPQLRHAGDNVLARKLVCPGVRLRLGGLKLKLLKTNLEIILSHVFHHIIEISKYCYNTKQLKKNIVLPFLETVTCPRRTKKHRVSKLRTPKNTTLLSKLQYIYILKH
jgi:hypothetical protein